jgi:hypothetical protein
MSYYDSSNQYIRNRLYDIENSTSSKIEILSSEIIKNDIINDCLRKELQELFEKREEGK